MQNKVVQKVNCYSAIAFVKIHGFHATSCMILKNGVRPTKSIVSRVLLILEH